MISKKFMNIDKEVINILNHEVLRYLGYRNQKISCEMESLIEETIKEAKKIIRPRYTYRYFDINKDKPYIINKTNDTIIDFEDFNNDFIGKDIVKHLSFSKGYYLLAATLGIEIDKRIRYYENVNLTKALILDACGTVAIENICDFVCSNIEDKLMKNNLTLTSRYSPGYGDFPIDVQGSFLRAIDGGKLIGLTVNEDNILIPRKSVTAVVGVIDKDLYVKDTDKCKACPNYFQCNYRKGSDVCGY